MFNIEQSIAEWRQQMLAAGIKTPVPLEELESHLHEEIERQIQSGMGEQRAFENAVRQIGEATVLKQEFKKTGFANLWGEDKNTRINRVFAFLWLTFCSWGFFPIAVSILFQFQRRDETLSFYLFMLIEFIFLRGMVASILLFAGKNNEIQRQRICFVAVLILVAGITSIVMNALVAASLPAHAHIVHVKIISPVEIIIIGFSAISLFLLHSPSPKNPDLATK